MARSRMTPRILCALLAATVLGAMLAVLIGPSLPSCNPGALMQDASSAATHRSSRLDKARSSSRLSQPLHKDATFIETDRATIPVPPPTPSPYIFSDCLFYARQNIERHSLVFTATTAHTGTSFLTALLETADGIEARHEDDPSLVSFPSVMRLGRAATLAFRSGVKVPPIYRRLASPGPAVFADVSHLFLKSWADASLHCLARDQRIAVSIVALRRYLPDLVRSLMTDVVWAAPSLDGFCGSEYTVHHANVAALPPLKPYAEEDVVDLVIGHVLDMEVQLAALRAVYGRGVGTDGGVGGDSGSGEVEDDDQTPYAADGFSMRRFSTATADAYRASVALLEDGGTAAAGASDTGADGGDSIAEPEGDGDGDGDGEGDDGEQESGKRSRKSSHRRRRAKAKGGDGDGEASLPQPARTAGLPAAIALLRSLAPPPSGLVARARFIDARLEALAAPHGARDLLSRRLRLDVQDKRLASRMGSGPVNARVSWKAPALQRIPDAFFLARAQRMIQAYATAGVVLPPLPQMDQLVPCDTLPAGVRPAESYAMRAGEPGPLCAVPFVPLDAQALQAALDAFPDHPAVDAATVAALSHGNLIDAATQVNGTLLGQHGLPCVQLNFRVADIQASPYRSVCPV